MREAIAHHRVLRFSYRDNADRVIVREVEPAKLLFKERSWYVRAWRRCDDWRTFKLLRMDWESIDFCRLCSNRAKPRHHAFHRA
ncbi:MAG: WYL domain-containing protein [Eggerthellaceae bacterium]